MRRKALLTGARLHPFVGPWVALEESSEWEMEGLRPGVRVEHLPGKARAIIEDATGDGRISVVAVEAAC